MWGLPMPKKGITGHDDWVLTEALATALVALEQLDTKHQPSAHMDDIRKMLSNGKEPAAVSLHLAQAKCRLFPDLDPLEIYREYGIGEEYGWMNGILIMATIARHWRLRLAPGHRVELLPRSGLGSKYGMKMVCEAREKP